MHPGNDFNTLKNKRARLICTDGKSSHCWHHARFHRCKSRQNFEGAKDFCPNFPELTRKKLERKLLPKKGSQVRRIFQIKAHFKHTRKEPNKNMTSRKASALWFWMPFLQIQSTYSDFANVFSYFAQISTYFAQILSDFARILTKSKLLGVPLYPLHHCLLHQFQVSFLFVNSHIQLLKNLRKRVHYITINYYLISNQGYEKFLWKLRSCKCVERLRTTALKLYLPGIFWQTYWQCPSGEDVPDSIDTWLVPPISLATWLCDFISFNWEKLLSPVTTDTGRVSSRKSGDMLEKFYQTVSVKKVQNFQRISKKLYTGFLCVNTLAMFNVYYKVLQWWRNNLGWFAGLDILWMS